MAYEAIDNALRLDIYGAYICIYIYGASGADAICIWAFCIDFLYIKKTSL
jgi:hypothetical protein